jgi:hypothetical protein
MLKHRCLKQLKIMEKKNILFFSRSELSYLYGSLNENLVHEFNIIHVAYSQYEADILYNEFGIEDVIIFKDLMKPFVNITPLDADLELIDAMLVEQSAGGFNLNSALQANRSSKFIGFEKSVELANVYFKTWTIIFERQKIDFFVHEPVSLLMNQMAAALCKKQGGIYTTHISVHGEKSQIRFIMVDHYNGVAVELKNRYKQITTVDINNQIDRINSFLTSFRSSYAVFFGAIGQGHSGIRFKFDILMAFIKRKAVTTLSSKKYDPVMDNIELFIDKDDLIGRRLKNIQAYNDIKYDEFDVEKTYYFYPLHLEPEAVVLYWADGLYTNQIKLIENVAAQLPANVYLYVKDHPHLYGYRDKQDYDRIQAIPNVKLLKPSLSGKLVIKDCKGVITINGTGGFEALLMNKHVITFGAAFYSVSERVKLIKDIRKLREHLYELRDVVYEDDEQLYRFIISYLESQKNGFTDFYGGMHKQLKVNISSNALIVAEELKTFFLSYPTFQKTGASVE